MPKLSLSPEAVKKGTDVPRRLEQTRVVNYPTTLASPAKKPFGIKRVLKKRLNDVHEDIRQYCSPVKKAKETYKDKKNDSGPISLISSLGSVPRRLTTLSIDCPAAKPHTPCDMPVQDVMPIDRGDKGVAVSIGATSLLPVTTTPLKIEEEVVDLLTPRTHNDVTVDDAVIDLLSEPSPRL